ncbi:MAG: hypothetical protein CM15mP127_12160 [Gammaproteobacteria bacterium]|nr:MAG: hypothetical protein CM15mP127_12160 [Gammaproteobacteria bacterium]
MRGGEFLKVKKCFKEACFQKNISYERTGVYLGLGDCMFGIKRSLEGRKKNKKLGQIWEKGLSLGKMSTEKKRGSFTSFKKEKKFRPEIKL